MKKLISFFCQTSLTFAIFVLFNSCSKDEYFSPLTIYGESRTIIQDEFQDRPYAVYANGELGFMQAYSRRTQDGTILDFERYPTFPTLFSDNEGNEWDVYGIAVRGPRKGQQLEVMNTMMGYWFSFATMFPRPTLFGEEEQPNLIIQSSDPTWLIDPQSVFIGAARDAIRSLDFPLFELHLPSIKNETYVADNELVVVINDGEIVRVYPHKILDYHEVVNDNNNFGETVLSYCPLTGTANIWSRVLDNQSLTFGVSGLLYNSNLILYDRQTNSNWSQMRQQSVNGEFIGRVPEKIPYLEMTWAGAKKLAKELLLMSNETGFGINYSDYPYGNYRTSERLITPVDFIDNRIKNKERVLAVIVNQKVKVYQFSNFN